MTVTRTAAVVAAALLVPALAVPTAWAGAGAPAASAAPAAPAAQAAPASAGAAVRAAGGPLGPAALRLAVPYPSAFGPGAPERSVFTSRTVMPCTTSSRTVRGSSGLARRADWVRGSDGAITQIAVVNVVQFSSAAAALRAWNAERAAMTSRCQGVRTLSTLDWVGRGKVTVAATPGYAGRAGVQQNASWRVLAMEGPGTDVMGEVVLQQLVGPAWIQVIARDMLRYSPGGGQIARAKALMTATTQRYAAAIRAS